MSPSFYEKFRSSSPETVKSLLEIHTGFKIKSGQKVSNYNKNLEYHGTTLEGTDFIVGINEKGVSYVWKF